MSAVTAAFTERADQWRRGVAIKKGTVTQDDLAAYRNRQKTLAEAAGSGTSELIRYLQTELNTGAGFLKPGEYIPVPSVPLSASEMIKPPPQAANRIWDALKTVRPSDASSPAFWTAVHIQWAQSSIIEEQWSKELTGGGDDKTARRTCRHLGGLPHVRGKTSVFTNCPISAVWWQKRLTSRIMKIPECDLTEERLSGMLSAVWDPLCDSLVKKASVMCNLRALAALLTYYDRQMPYGFPDKHAFRVGLHHMASFSKVASFEILPWDGMLGLCSGLKVASD